MPAADPETDQKLKLFVKETCKGQTRDELFPEKPNRENDLSADANGKIQEE